MYYETDAPAVVTGGNNNDGMFSGGWGGLIGLIAVAALFGFGGNGFGWGGGNNGALTRSDLCQDMNFNNLESAVRGIANGICDSTFALNNTITSGFAGVQSTLCQGFGGVNSAIMQQGYESRLATQGLSAQLASCCCDVERGIERLACQSATDTAAIIQSGANNTQRILDYLCNEKIEALRAENTLLTSQLSQNAQTRTIIDTLLPVAKPAYITCSPYVSAFGYPYAASGYGYGNSCGCGTSVI